MKVRLECQAASAGLPDRPPVRACRPSQASCVYSSILQCILEYSCGVHANLGFASTQAMTDAQLFRYRCKQCKSILKLLYVTSVDAHRWRATGPEVSRNAPRQRRQAASARRCHRPRPRRMPRNRTAACFPRRSLPLRSPPPSTSPPPSSSAWAALPDSWAARHCRSPALLKRSAPSPACPCTAGSRRPCGLLPPRCVPF